MKFFERKLGEARKIFAGRGVKFIPLQWRSKQPAVEWTPIVENPQTDLDLEQLFPPRKLREGVAVLLGPEVVCLDLETEPMAKAAYEAIPELQGCVQVRTGRVRNPPGHVYFLAEDTGLQAATFTKKGIVGDDGKAFEIRTGNLYCAIPPSFHPNGMPYEWANPDAVLTSVPGIASKLDTFIEAQGLEKKKSKTKKARIEQPNRTPTPSDNFFEQVRQAVRVSALIGAKSANYWARTRCPFHGVSETHDAPFAYNDALNGYVCHSTRCGESGDVIDLFLALNGCTNRSEAAVRLAESRSIPIPDGLKRKYGTQQIQAWNRLKQKMVIEVN